ncbi:MULTISPECIES: arsenic resistance protein [Kocuria]|nr:MULTISPECIES: bile acid:sodium symporter [unclassified Kocuria]
MEFLERHQVALYLGAMVLGAVLGLAAPQAAPTLEVMINPAIALMLFSTFLAIPVTHIGQGFKDVRFLGVLLALNFVVAPVVVWALTLPFVQNPALLVGILLVLLVPCIDWVIVFTGLAGGDSARLTAAAPVLMVVQMVALAPLMVLIGGPQLVVDVPPGPFITALVLLLLLPLAAAGLLQALARRCPVAARVQTGGQAVMVPSLMVVLVVVIASQMAGLGSRWIEVIWAVPVFVGFAAVMIAAAVAAARLTRTTTTPARALVFSAVARNSLVVLPLALALPERYDLVPLVVLTQTMVELVLMVVMLRAVPLVVPTHPFRR